MTPQLNNIHIYVVCVLAVTSSPLEITILVNTEKYLIEKYVVVERKNSIKKQKLQGFIKVRGNEFSISFIYLSTQHT